MDIEFIEKEHKYIDPEGNVIPSVTEILSMINSGYDKVNPAVLEHAAMKGTLVHEWCEMYDYGCEEEQVPSELEPYCRAYMDFCRDYKPEWELVEGIVYCGHMPEGKGYAGTVDRYGKLRGRRSVVDIKTIASPGTKDHIKVCCQTAGYATALSDYATYRYALYLKPDGTYRLMDCEEYERTHGFSGFALFSELYHIHAEISEIGGRNGKR